MSNRDNRLGMYLTCLILASAPIVVTGCDDDGGTASTDTPRCTVSPTVVTAPAEGGQYTLVVDAEREWTAYSDDAWLACDIQAGQSAVVVDVAQNTLTEAREGTVTVKCGQTRVNISVMQDAKPKEEISADIEVPDGYTLVWHDEFDSGAEPDASLWYYETGGGGWGNNELQHYVAGTYNDEQLATVNDGVLTITAKKIGDTVYSIRMNTRESWTYGYFEARLRVPSGLGTWPAFWMLPKNFTSWPLDGEIDIMEHVGYDPNVVVTTIHCNAYNHMYGTQKTASTRVSTAQTEFHVYACEWTADYISMFIDGREVFRFSNDRAGNKDTWPFDAPFYLKLNLAWGGAWGGAQGIDESVLPATYDIDYVRVFQKE